MADELTQLKEDHRMLSADASENVNAKRVARKQADKIRADSLKTAKKEAKAFAKKEYPEGNVVVYNRIWKGVCKGERCASYAHSDYFVSDMLSASPFDANDTRDESIGTAEVDIENARHSRRMSGFRKKLVKENTRLLLPHGKMPRLLFYQKKSDDAWKKNLENLCGLRDPVADGYALPCPRCGKRTMNPFGPNNTVSRYCDVYICNNCGAEETKGRNDGRMPLSQWSLTRSISKKRKV